MDEQAGGGKRKCQVAAVLPIGLGWMPLQHADDSMLMGQDVMGN